ncbi:calcium-binding protein [Thalassovita mangrovi]|nr:calcium-binding protein [Thalassovita mangrovi]
MPSTYTIEGFSFWTSSITGYPVIDYHATLTAEGPTNGASVSYTTTGTGYDTLFDFTSNLTSVEVEGGLVSMPVSIPINRSTAAVWRMSWDGHETDVLMLVQPFGTTQNFYIFPLAGYDVSYIDTMSEFASFLQGLEDGSPVSDGPIAPDQPIFLADLDDVDIARLPKPQGVTEIGSDVMDFLYGDAGDDSVNGMDGNDYIYGRDGADTLIGGAGDDSITGGQTADDERDNVYAGDGNDNVDGGYGNDELRGDAGNDTLTGGYGADTVLGGDGNDVLTGQAWGDLLFGGNGDDFINGGYGYDRVNGGDGADEFYHLGVAGHGSDWIQDYDAAEGDVLVFGGSASLDQFQVNYTETANAGVAGVEEAFVIYRPTGQILWALVDGGGQDQINLVLDEVTYDLLA